MATMTTIHMDYGDTLVIDPCYVKNVSTKYGDITEQRFDGLCSVKMLHSGDDGCYEINNGKESHFIGVDSGRIWVMLAQFDIDVEIDAGLSGFWLEKAPSRNEYEIMAHANSFHLIPFDAE